MFFKLLRSAHDATARLQPLPPFNESYSIIVLTGGTVYGLLNPTNTASENACSPQQMDIVIAAGKILQLLNPSMTASFIDSMRSIQVPVLPISVPDQLIIPGLIDVHVHAIGGGGEQGRLPMEYMI